MITIQLHGSLKHMYCQQCKETYDFNSALFDSAKAPPRPSCEQTDQTLLQEGKRSHGVGRLRPGIVLYNEDHPEADTIGTIVRANMA